MPTERVGLMGLDFAAFSERETIEYVLGAIAEDGRGGWICPSTWTCCVSGVRRPRCANSSRRRTWSSPMACRLIWAGGLQGSPLPERVAGSTSGQDPQGRRRRAGERRSSYSAATRGQLTPPRHSSRRAHPSVRVAGTLCPPFGFEARSGLDRSDRVVLARGGSRHRLRRPGFPKQERLIVVLADAVPDVLVRLMRHLVQLPCRRCSAGSGVHPAARPRVAASPAQEPKRLFRRYLVDGIPFLFELLWSALIVRASRSPSASSRMRVIRAKAPLRVSFAGGGTDVPPFPEREGGLVLSATINRYAYGALAPRSDSQIGLESVDFGLSLSYGGDEELIFDGRLDLAKAAIRKMGRGGYDMFLHSNAPPGSGLGSSSAVMVALIGLLKEFHRQTADRLRGSSDWRTISSARTSASREAFRISTPLRSAGSTSSSSRPTRVDRQSAADTAGRGSRAGAQHASLLHGQDEVLGRHHRAPNERWTGGDEDALAGLGQGKSWPSR